MKKQKNNESIARLLPIDYLKSIGRYSDKITESLEKTIGFPADMKSEIAKNGGKIVSVVKNEIELRATEKFFKNAGIRPMKLTLIKLSESRAYRGWIIPSNWIVKL